MDSERKNKVVTAVAALFQKGFSFLSPLFAPAQSLSKPGERLPRRETIAAIISKAINQRTTIRDILEREYAQFLRHEETLSRISALYQSYSIRKMVADPLIEFPLVKFFQLFLGLLLHLSFFLRQLRLFQDLFFHKYRHLCAHGQGDAIRWAGINGFYFRALVCLNY
jgi:hypothetical protein